MSVAAPIKRRRRRKASEDVGEVAEGDLKLADKMVSSERSELPAPAVKKTVRKAKDVKAKDKDEEDGNGKGKRGAKSANGNQVGGSAVCKEAEDELELLGEVEGGSTGKRRVTTRRRREATGATTSLEEKTNGADSTTKTTSISEGQPDITAEESVKVSAGEETESKSKSKVKAKSTATQNKEEEEEASTSPKLNSKTKSSPILEAVAAVREQVRSRLREEPASERYPSAKSNAPIPSPLLSPSSENPQASQVPQVEPTQTLSVSSPSTSKPFSLPSRLTLIPPSISAQATKTSDTTKRPQLLAHSPSKPTSTPKPAPTLSTAPKSHSLPSASPTPTSPPTSAPPIARARSPLLLPSQPGTPSSKPPTDIRKTPTYKRLSWRWTSGIVATSVLVVTSFELYNRCTFPSFYSLHSCFHLFLCVSSYPQAGLSLIHFLLFEQ